MDLEEWEFLPVTADHAFLGFQEDQEEEISFQHEPSSDLFQKSALKANEFRGPSPDPRKFLDPSGNSNSVVPVPVQVNPAFQEDPEEETKEVISEKEPAVETVPIPPVIIDRIKASDAAGADQETVSQVFFKKMKENEFVDMKMDSPKSGDRVSIPQTDANLIHFDEESEAVVKKSFPRKNMWKWGKWGMAGIGAVCSFGVAAAVTICIVAIGSSQRNKQHLNQKLGFDIYSDKRGKQVNQHAVKLNDAISALRGTGVHVTRAHITVGGYCDDR